MIAGGCSCGVGSFAAGSQAFATNDGVFVWADTNNFPFYSALADEFAVRASGGVRFVSAINSLGAPIAGVELPPGGGAWTVLSDRNSKEHLQPVNPGQVLDKLAALPVSSWNYISQPASVRHIGPMAQDFKTAFGFGETATGISTVDEDGVALAAIQGLDQKLEQKETEIRELKARLDKLEQLINQSRFEPK